MYVVSRLLLSQSSRLLAVEIYGSRGIHTEVQHASTSPSIVDDAPGPSTYTTKIRRPRPRDVIPHDPRRASRNGKVGFGSSVTASKPVDPTADKASKTRKKARPASAKDAKVRVPRTENPFVLAPRLAEIYRKHGTDKALAELATSKHDARTVAVHNILIKLLLQDGRVDAAYKVWMNMKRMGLVPTPMSYTTFFSSISPEQALSREAREKLNTIWKQWQSYCEKAANPDDTLHELAQSPEYRVSSTPTNAYLATFQKTSRKDIVKVSELFDSLMEIPGFVPTAHTFTVIFRNISELLQSRTPADQADFVVHCYGLCKKAWDMMYDKWQNSGFQPDALVLSAAGIAYRQLFQTSPSLFSQDDKKRILTQIESLLGLQDEEAIPEAKQSARVKAPTNLDDTAVYDAMVLASMFEGRYSRHVLDWFTSLKQYQPNLLNARVCEMYMKAAPKAALDTLVYMLRSPSTAMRPTLSTYSTAISLSSFINQVRILAHMTGRNEMLEASEAPLLKASVEATNQEGKLSKRALEKGYHTKHIQPDDKTMVILLQTALDLQDWRRIDRALRITTMIKHNAHERSGTNPVSRGKADTYALRYSEALKQACQQLLLNPAVSQDRKAELRSLQRDQAKEITPRLDRTSRSHSRKIHE